MWPEGAAVHGAGPSTALLALGVMRLRGCVLT